MNTKTNNKDLKKISISSTFAYNAFLVGILSFSTYFLVKGNYIVSLASILIAIVFLYTYSMLRIEIALSKILAEMYLIQTFIGVLQEISSENIESIKNQIEINKSCKYSLESLHSRLLDIESSVFRYKEDTQTNNIN